MKSKQSGGVVSFVVIAIVLAGLFAGGLYFSKHQARVARDTNTSTPDVTSKDESSNEQQPADEDEKKSTQESKPEQEQQASQQTERPATGSDSSGTSSTRTDRVATTGPSGDIPQTGPTETAGAILAIVLLGFATTTALQSRRNMTRAALR